MVRRIFVFVLSVFAAFAASAKICTWTGGSGKWSEGSKWENGEVPAAGDTVYIRNATESAVIENDISDLVLAQLFVVGDAACTLSGAGVTLTDAKAFSNGVANARCELPLALSAQKPCLYTYGKMVFSGDGRRVHVVWDDAAVAGRAKMNLSALRPGMKVYDAMGNDLAGKGQLHVTLGPVPVFVVEER